MRLLDDRISTRLPDVHGSKSRQWLLRPGPMAQEREQHYPWLGGFVRNDNVKRNYRGRDAGMLLQRGSVSIGTPVLSSDATAPNAHWNEASTTPDSTGGPRMVRITHPFHPLCGREYRLITYRKNWGEDRLYFHNEEGRLVGIPVHWTDFFGLDAFQEVAAGRAHFRPEELLVLAQLIERLRPAADTPTPQGGANERK